MTLPKPRTCMFMFHVICCYGELKGVDRFTVYRDADLFDFINAPVGKGLPISQQLRPLIAGKFY